jgi:hypothetical protein
MRPGRVPNPFKPHWAVQTLIWVFGAVVAVLYILVPVLETPAKYLEWFARNPGEFAGFQEAWPSILAATGDDSGIKWLLAQSQTWVGMFVLKHWVWLNTALFAVVVGGLSFLVWRSAWHRSIPRQPNRHRTRATFSPVGYGIW